MDSNQDTFQIFWELSRQKGQQTSKYPYDKVISFVFKFYPRHLPKAKINILEIGCGVGNNLWPLAKEGFNVYGIDGSETAINIAHKQFESYGVNGRFNVQDFTENYPFENDFFDLVIDRAALTCVSLNHAVTATNHIYRVMKKDGFFFFNPYSTQHSSYQHNTEAFDYQNNYIKPVSGTLAGIGNICFYSQESIQQLFPCDRWKISQMKKVVWYDSFDEKNIHSEWEVILQKL